MKAKNKEAKPLDKLAQSKLIKDSEIDTTDYQGLTIAGIVFMVVGFCLWAFKILIHL